MNPAALSEVVNAASGPGGMSDVDSAFAGAVEDAAVAAEAEPA